LLAGATLGLAAWSCRTNACAHASLAASTAEKACLWFVNNFEFGIIFCNAQLVERGFLGFFECAACCFYPFHGVLNFCV
jgi:hypothetical protein